jgi:outer membrane protein assembly factor BamD
MQLRILASAVVLALATTGCASSPDDDYAEIPPAETLYEEGVTLMETGTRFWGLDLTDYEDAIDRFQDVIDNYPYSDLAVLAELRIADAYFEQKRYDEALSYYREFGELHPDHEKVPYTILRSALSFYHQSKDPSRDQTASREALDTLDGLITRYPRSPEVTEAEILWRELRTKLARHELMIGDFYLEETEYQSAANRYRDVLNEYPGLGLDAEALYKLGVCYTHMSREEEARHIFEVILRNYEGSEIADAAQDLVPAAN